MSESFHPDDGEENGASTSQESLEASPGPAVAAPEGPEGNVQASLLSCRFFPIPLEHSVDFS